MLDAVGGTPLVRLNRLPAEAEATVWVKLEGLNPSGSVKVRPAASMVTQARDDGRLEAGGTIVEATSGNLGIALAMVGATLGHPVTIMVDPRTPRFSVASIAAYEFFVTAARSKPSIGYLSGQTLAGKEQALSRGIGERRGGEQNGPIFDQREHDTIR